MATRIPFGEPQNDSERWAFDFLEANLPDDIEFLTNIEVLSDTGQPFEVDAIVLAPYAIHFIDVKGYRGSVRADTNAWELDERMVENPLPKANHVARMFASRMRRRAPGDAHTPWCQGGAFLTGVRGDGLSLVKGDPWLCVWDPDTIVEALSTDLWITSPYRHRITEEQLAFAKDVAGQAEAALRRSNTIGDFERSRRLYRNGGLEVWLAEYRQPGMERRFLLKVLDPSGFGSAKAASNAESRLRTEAALYFQLAGLPGIPYAAPLIDSGELLALPIRLPAGTSLAQYPFEAADPKTRLKILRAAAASMQAVHDRGVVHGGLKPDSIFVTQGGEVELLDIGIESDAKPADDLSALASAFDRWFDDSAPEVRRWLDGETHDLERLRRAIFETLDPPEDRPVAAEVKLEPGEIVAGHFQLLEEFRRDGEIRMWRARHRIGRFDCALSISEQGEEGLKRIQAEFELLSRIFHPNVCRVFEAGSIDDQRHYIARAWVPGRSLAGHIRDEGEQDEALVHAIARQVASALQYLHASGITHRDICPASMMLDDDRLVIVDLGMSDPQDVQSGSVPFRDPRVIEHGWTRQADLYALALVLLCVASGQPIPPLRTSSRWPDFYRDGVKKLPEAVVVGVTTALELFPGGTPGDYLSFFGVGEEEEPLTKLPDEFRERWGISKGYMEFLVVDMINDGRARSRKQWVLNALRSRRISGNKTNYNSMNATISRLLSAGVAEKHRTKVRLTEEFACELQEKDGIGQV